MLVRNVCPASGTSLIRREEERGDEEGQGSGRTGLVNEAFRALHYFPIHPDRCENGRITLAAPERIFAPVNLLRIGGNDLPDGLADSLAVFGGTDSTP